MFLENPCLRYVCTPWLYTLGRHGLASVYDADGEDDTGRIVISGGYGHLTASDHMEGTVTIGGVQTAPEYLGDYAGKPAWKCGSSWYLFWSRNFRCWVLSPDLAEPVEFDISDYDIDTEQTTTLKLGSNAWSGGASLPSIGQTATYSPRGSNRTSGAAVTLSIDVTAWECRGASAWRAGGVYSPIGDATGTVAIGYPSWKGADGSVLVRSGWDSHAGFLDGEGNEGIQWDAEAGGYVVAEDATGRWIATEAEPGEDIVAEYAWNDGVDQADRTEERDDIELEWDGYVSLPEPESNRATVFVAQGVL